MLDWNMTPMNGLQFMEQFIQVPKWARIPVVLLTADSKAEEKVKLAPFAGALRKPMAVNELLELSERYC